MYPTLLPVYKTYNPLTFDLKRPTLRLWSIGLPEGYKISFDYNSSGSGELAKRTLPTNQTGDLSGPRMEYDYDIYGYYRRYFAQGDISSSKVSTGIFINLPTSYCRHITAKRLYLLTNPNQFTDTTVSEAASWSYTRAAYPLYTNPNKVSVRTTIGAFTNETVHYFHSSMESQDPALDGKGANDGLAPEWDDGLNYRTEYWEGLEGSGRLLRTEDISHEPDIDLVTPAPPPPYPSVYYTKDNIRTVQTVTTFTDDGNKQMTTLNSNWDGSGHWKTVAETGFGMATPRLTHTNYIRTALRSDIYAYRAVSDGNTVFSRSEYEYDDSGGHLVKSIDRKVLPSAPNTPVQSTLTGLEGDVVTEYEYYGTANGSTECLAPVTGNVCRKVVSTGVPGPARTPSVTSTAVTMPSNGARRMARSRSACACANFCADTYAPSTYCTGVALWLP